MIIISIDIEADGPIPGMNSMLQLGAVAFAETGQEVGAFQANLAPLDGAVQDPDTMKFWSRHKETWEMLQHDQRSPELTMAAFAAWLKSLDSSYLFYCAPVGFDFVFLRWYMVRFGHNFPHNALDLRSMMFLFTGEYNGEIKKKIRKTCDWKHNKKHTHVAVEDAREQGQYLFAAIKRFGPVAQEIFTFAGTHK